MGTKTGFSGLKTVVINGFISWRINQRKNFLDSAESFKSIESFCNCVNRVQSTADFMLDVSVELLQHAAAIGNEENEQSFSDSDVVNTEERTLVREAFKRKGKRLFFFNSDRGKILRLKVKDHVPKKCGEKYCVLCGNVTKKENETLDMWRGHRSSYSCQKCCVNLCR